MSRQPASFEEFEVPEHHNEIPDEEYTGAGAIGTLELDSLLAGMGTPVFTGDMANEIFERAHIRGVPPARVAFEMQLPITNATWWKAPTAIDETEFEYRGLNLMGRSDNVLTRYAHSVARTMQFRLDSAYLHGLGVVSSAMVHNFRYQRFGVSKPPGLYTIASQPSGSGKSGVDDYFASPVRQIVQEHNEYNRPQREQLELELEDKIKERAHKKTGTNQRKSLGVDIQGIEKELKKYQEYVYGVTDATPEGLEEKCVGVNEGVFTIVSDEAEAVTVLIGANYGDGNANLGIMLSGWEGGHQHSLRTGRGGYWGHVYGAIAVLAQKTVIDAILSAGRDSAAGSRGAAERFLAISEPDNFDNMNPHAYFPIDSELQKQYTETMKNIFNQEPCEIEFDQTSAIALNKVKSKLIAMVRTGGKYNNSFMQSVAIKGDVQVAKIATVLHVLENWKPGGNRSRLMDTEFISQAEHTFFQCLKSFEIAADDRGIAGSKTEVSALIRKIKVLAQDKKYWSKPVKCGSFCDSIKTNIPFKGKTKVVSMIKNLLPELERLNYIIYDNDADCIYINPLLRD